MKKYFIAAIIILLLVLRWQYERIKVIDYERKSYRQDTWNLLENVRRYQVLDSLNVVSVGQLELKLSEVNRYRANEMKLIESLKMDKTRLQKITTTQTKAIYDLLGAFRDSVIYVDNQPRDTLHCVAISNKWYDIAGCIDKNFKFSGRFENRDSLLYVEHIVPKRFLFFRWGCKERRQEIISLNPYTSIVNAEFIVIRK